MTSERIHFSKFIFDSTEFLECQKLLVFRLAQDTTIFLSHSLNIKNKTKQKKPFLHLRIGYISVLNAFWFMFVHASAVPVCLLFGQDVNQRNERAFTKKNKKQPIWMTVGKYRYFSNVGLMSKVLQKIFRAQMSYLKNRLKYSNKPLRLGDWCLLCQIWNQPFCPRFPTE